MALIPIPGTNLKALPLNALPPEAWSIIGGNETTNAQEVRDVYAAVPTVFRGVDIRANAYNKVPWQITRMRGNSDEPLWERGTAAPTELEWCSNLPQLLKLTGASKALVSQAFWFIERNRARPLSVRWWSPLATKAVWDERAGLTHYERNVGMGGLQRFELEDVCYIWDVHPLHETQPKPSPAQAALAAANVLYSVDKLAANYFERGAIRATLLAVSGATTTEEKERLKTWWGRVTSGVKNAFTTHVINSDAVNPVQIGDGLSELNSAELTADKRQDIAIALGVPHSMLFADAANYATAQQDELNFYNSTIIPDITDVADQLNTQLFHRYGYHFEWLPETMDVYQEDENQRAQAFAQYTTAGLPLSLAAEMLGLELPAGWEYADLDVEPEPQTITVIPGQATQGQPGQPRQAQPPQLAMADAAQDAQMSDQRKAAEADTFRRWLRKNPNRLSRADDFDAHVLTAADKATIVAEFNEEAKATRIIPRGVDEPLLPIPSTLDITDDDIEHAIAMWDSALPDYARLLEADAKNSGEGL